MLVETVLVIMAVYFLTRKVLLLVYRNLLDWHEARRKSFPPKHHPHYAEVNVEKTGDHSTGFYKGIYWQIYAPKSKETQVSAVVVMFHGYGDHSDYMFPKHAEKIYNHCGVAVVLFDQPGFGRSEGLWGLIPDWFLHTQKCENFVNGFVRNRFPGKKIFAFGASMGGGLALTLSIQNPKIFNGLLLLAPMCKIGEKMKPPAFIITLLRFVSFLFPELPIAPVPDVTKLSYRDASVVSRIFHENLLGFNSRPRLATALSLLQAQDWICKNMEKLTAPFLVMHGTMDVVTNPEYSQELFIKASSQDKRFELLEGYFHVIVGGGQPEKFDEKPYQLIFDWINKSHDK
jgi:alpha-beta hydrolase superfamily lysophospholipase